MNTLQSWLDLPPRVWPSLTELASELNLRPRRELNALSQVAGRQGFVMQRLGRTVRVAPEDAVRLLGLRGLTTELATSIVLRLLREHIQEVPALRDSVEPVLSDVRSYWLRPEVRRVGRALRERQPEFALGELKGEVIGDTDALLELARGTRP